MNRRGESIFLGIISGIVVFMFGVLFVNFLGTDITTSQSSTNLDCTNSSITDGTRLNCLGTDIIVPYYFIILIAVSVGAIIGRFI